MTDTPTTKTYFLRVCRKFVKMDRKRADACLEKLMELEPGYRNRKKGKPYYFRRANLFAAIQEDEVFRKMLEKQKYRDWDDVAERVEYWDEGYDIEQSRRSRQERLREEEYGAGWPY